MEESNPWPTFVDAFVDSIKYLYFSDASIHIE